MLKYMLSESDCIYYSNIGLTPYPPLMSEEYDLFLLQHLTYSKGKDDETYIIK